MLSKLEKKILQTKTVRLGMIAYEFKRVTPADFLDKDGVPLSKWQVELGKELTAIKDGSDSLTAEKLKKQWLRLFKKAIISINGKNDNLDALIELLVDNYYISSELYAEIAKHCLQFKKKINFLNLFQRQFALI